MHVFHLIVCIYVCMNVCHFIIISIQWNLVITRSLGPYINSKSEQYKELGPEKIEGFVNTSL